MIEGLDQGNVDGAGQRRSIWSILTVVVLAIALAIPSFVLLRERISLNRTNATIDGLTLRFERVEWLEDQMNHGTSIPMPASMTPDLPERGSHRLSLELSIYNEGPDSRRFDADEVLLRTSNDRSIYPALSQLSDVTLLTGQSTYFPIQFDVEDSEEELRIVWTRGGTEIGMLAVPHSPEHETSETYEATDWPEDVDDLPPGDFDAGKLLYSVKFGCEACHGDPEVPESNRLAPHLGHIGVEAGRHVQGQSAALYIYESLLEPNLFISENCRAGPCASPSSMPPFGRVMTPKMMADLVTYLLEMDGSGFEASEAVFDDLTPATRRQPL